MSESASGTETEQLAEIVERILNSYAEHGNINHLDDGNLPSRAEIGQLLDDLLALVFPGFFGPDQVDGLSSRYFVGDRCVRSLRTLERVIDRAMGEQFGKDAGIAERAQYRQTDSEREAGAEATGLAEREQREAPSRRAEQFGKDAGIAERAQYRQTDSEREAGAEATGLAEREQREAPSRRAEPVGEPPANPADRSRQARAHAVDLLEHVPAIRGLLAIDVRAALDGDPAACSPSEVITSYPGITAIAVHRLAHHLYTRQVPLIPRMMSELVHGRTGIDIHPGAQIGNGFFIDHGTGVVVGETTVIGDRVKLYQGVTLGALSVERDDSQRKRKRHPTLEDEVTVYAGATILGGDTLIGKGSVIGGNVWLTHSVPAMTTVMLDKPALRFVAGDEG